MPVSLRFWCWEKLYCAAKRTPSKLVAMMKVKTRGDEAASVDQHEGAGGAEAAQIDGGGARGAVGEVAALAGEGLRQRVDQILGPGRALEADFLAVDHGDRAGRG